MEMAAGVVVRTRMEHAFEMVAGIQCTVHNDEFRSKGGSYRQQQNVFLC
jgi:hypothetical protein